MLDPEADPAAKRSTEGGSISPETDAPADEGEGTTTVVPSTEEAETEVEGGSGDAKPDDSAKSQDGKAKPEVEEYEIFLEGEEDHEPLPKDPAAANNAFARERKAAREAAAEAARLKRELEALKGSAGGPPDPGESPTSAECAYDDKEFAKRVLEWNAKKAAHDSWKAEQAQKEEVQRQASRAKITNYEVARNDLAKRVPGFAEAELAVAKGMSGDRQDLLLEYSENPARTVYLLGRNPERLRELATETDKGRFIMKLAKLEASVKERKKTQPPPPPKSPGGSGAIRGGTDMILERLREEADKTRDYTKVNAYKREQQRKREAGRK